MEIRTFVGDFKFQKKKTGDVIFSKYTKFGEVPLSLFPLSILPTDLFL